MTRRIIAGLTRRVDRHKFALAAFLIPLTIRALPEIIAGPYPIGYDTIAFYVPWTLEWSSGKGTFLGILGIAPLMFMISVPVYVLSRINPIWIFKIMGPILYGGMIWALFRFTRIGIGWSERDAFAAALLTSLYFVTLRIGWDLYRNMLGLALVLLCLPLFRKSAEFRSQVMISALVLLAVASDQLTGVLALSLLGLKAMIALLRQNRSEFMRFGVMGIPGLALFSSIVFADINALQATLVQEQPLLPNLQSFDSSIGFLVYAYLVLIPFILIGIKNVQNTELAGWSVLCIVATLSALLPLYGFVVVSYRWSLLLDIPACIYAYKGLACLGSPRGFPINRFRWVAKKSAFIFPLVLVLLAILYVALPVQQSFVYYSAFPSLLPTSMTQNTVSLSDMHSLEQAFGWIALNISPGTALITHQAFYGWARLYLPNFNGIINYGDGNPLSGAQTAIHKGYSSILMIWWVNGLGWDGQPFVSNDFVPIHQDGNFVIYGLATTNEPGRFWFHNPKLAEPV